MTADECRREIEAILRDELRISVPGPDADLIGSGLLDSLTLVDLVVSMERRFGIVVSLIELDLEDLGTVNSLTKFVHARVG